MLTSPMIARIGMTTMMSISQPTRTHLQSQGHRPPAAGTRSSLTVRPLNGCETVDGKGATPSEGSQRKQASSPKESSEDEQRRMGAMSPAGLSANPRTTSAERRDRPFVLEQEALRRQAAAETGE